MTTVKCWQYESRRAPVPKTEKSAYSPVAPLKSIWPVDSWAKRRAAGGIARSTSTGTVAAAQTIKSSKDHDQAITNWVLHAGTPALEMDNGAFLRDMRFSNHSETPSLAPQTSLKGNEGPGLVVFSGGTAFNSVAGALLARCCPCYPGHSTIMKHPLPILFQ